MATRFETLSGLSLGCRYAGSDGAEYYLTKEEQQRLFSLELDTEVTSDNQFQGNVRELMDLYVKCKKTTKEEFERRWGTPSENAYVYKSYNDRCKARWE